MKTKGKYVKRLCFALVFILCFNLIPGRAAAVEQGTEETEESCKACEHHPFHTEECGYTEAVPESPCAHIHTEECWRTEIQCVYEDMVHDDTEEEALPSDAHVCSEATGCVTKILDCQHLHDEECGYAEAVPGHPCEFICPICSGTEEQGTEDQEMEEPEEESQDTESSEEENPVTEELETEGPQKEDIKTAPYYLLLVHVLESDGIQYGFSEVIGLDTADFQDGSYDLQQHVLKKTGMELGGVFCLNPETGDMEQRWTVSPEDFAQAGNPEDGSDYLALQVLFTYQVLDGYRAVLSGDSAQTEDPYGIMPLTSFEGGNIKDITFVPADVLTVEIQYKYSPTGGLAGMDAADSQIIQLRVDDVKRDESGSVIRAGEIDETWALPYYTPGSYSALEGFRIVLDPAPLNAFLNNPTLAEQAMRGELTQSEIYQALESDAFSVNTGNPDQPVYEWQALGQNPPGSYESYPENVTYQNRYSDSYNEAWDDARSFGGSDKAYTARAYSSPAVANQGANPLVSPQLSLKLTEEQCAAALNGSGEITVTVYYRRNAGFYHVGHWVPRASLSSKDIENYTQAYQDYNTGGVAPFDSGYLMVCLERKQGRMGALTNARPNPPEAEEILSTFLPQAVSQKTIEANTRVDILYNTADRYGLIFHTEDSYIPRQYVMKGDTVVFTSDTDAVSGMQVTNSAGEPVDKYTDYVNPVQQGYTFEGWKYEVRADAAGAILGNDQKYYKEIKLKDVWAISEDMLAEAVVIRDSNSGDAKMIYLYPVWTPAKANVRVIFWTENLGGKNNDVDVETDLADDGGKDYRNRVGNYLNGSPNTVGSQFSNVGSFTFMADTQSRLDLQVSGKAFSSTVDKRFETTGETKDGQPDNQTGKLSDLIDEMFVRRMPDVNTSMAPINTSKFYYPYQVERGNKADYTVAADGSTVINVYYAREVYTLDFTYYGTISGNHKSGTKHDGPDGLVVATNTTGYSKRDKTRDFKYDYDVFDDDSSKSPDNRWQRVDTTNGAVDWTVPEKITISAKYDADLREVWPLSNGEQVKLILGASENADMKTVAIFMSWGTTDGPYNAKYRDDINYESTIIGNYRSMSADIIADAEEPAVVHHLVGYWWNKTVSYYRRNACYEVPGLTAEKLLDAMDKGEGVITFDLTKWERYIQGLGVSEGGSWPVDTENHMDEHISSDEKTRRDMVYLVPVSGSLSEYFEDYRSNFIQVNEDFEPDDKGGYYALRRISLEQDSTVYALGRQAASVSTNYILAQEPSTMPNMTSVSFTYVCDGKDENVSVDHDSRVWDNWGRTAPAEDQDKNPCGFVALGTADAPYDIWFYYDRMRFEIHYIVSARRSLSGEYEMGHAETVYGQSLKNFNVPITVEQKKVYSNDPAMTKYWIPTDNSALVNTSLSAGVDTGLNENGFTRLAPNSAPEGKGIWKFYGWALDRACTNMMVGDGWNEWDKMVTGNLRVYARWESPNYRVKFDLNGGSYNGSDTFPIQEVPANVGYTSSGQSIPSPVWDGYEFNGWTWYEGKAVGNDDLAAVGDPISDFTFEKPIIQDMVLVANWVPSARTSYNYKIWYLTDDADAEPADLPVNVEGKWLTSNRGVPSPGSGYEKYTHVLGCQYVSGKAYPEHTVLTLAAVAIPGYAPVNISAALPLDGAKNGTGAEDTGNVAYFYYRKSPVKSYTIRFQLYDKSGEDGILNRFTTESVVADSTYFTPSEKTWRGLKELGYQLVQMNADGTAKLNGSEPIPAKDYLALAEFINKENERFAGLARGEKAVITFKVAPIPYAIQYRVGTVKKDGVFITPGDSLKTVMQDALDQLSGGKVPDAVPADQNPTGYMVTDFNGGYSFTLKNPVTVVDPEDSTREWRFTSWSLGDETKVVSRASGGEYPTLMIERSVGDLEFLANWESGDGGSAPDDPDNPPDNPGNPPDGPDNPPGSPEEPPTSPDSPPDNSGSLTAVSLSPSDNLENPPVLPDENVPMHLADVPETGDKGIFIWVLLGIFSFSGMVVLLKTWPGRKKKDNGDASGDGSSTGNKT